MHRIVSWQLLNWMIRPLRLDHFGLGGSRCEIIKQAIIKCFLKVLLYNIKYNNRVPKAEFRFNMTLVRVRRLKESEKVSLEKHSRE